MENPLDTQLLIAAATVLTGVSLGFVYDIFRVIRQRSGKTAAAVICDVLFCAVTAAVLFLLGMGPGGGDMRLYMPAAAAGGAAIYFLIFGATVRQALNAAADVLAKILAVIAIPVKKVLNLIKKCEKYFKNIFSRIEKWFTIIHNNATIAASERKGGVSACAEGETYEIQKGKFIYENSYSRADSLRGNKSGFHEKPHRRGEALQENAELQYDIDHAGDVDTIEEIARTKLGLVRPGEKIFYDVSN